MNVRYDLGAAQFLLSLKRSKDVNDQADLTVIVNKIKDGLVVGMPHAKRINLDPPTYQLIIGPLELSGQSSVGYRMLWTSGTKKEIFICQIHRILLSDFQEDILMHF